MDNHQGNQAQRMVVVTTSAQPHFTFWSKWMTTNCTIRIPKKIIHWCPWRQSKHSLLIVMRVVVINSRSFCLQLPGAIEGEDAGQFLLVVLFTKTSNRFCRSMFLASTSLRSVSQAVDTLMASTGLLNDKESSWVVLGLVPWSSTICTRYMVSWCQSFSS